MLLFGELVEQCTCYYITDVSMVLRYSSGHCNCPDRLVLISVVAVVSLLFPRCLFSCGFLQIDCEVLDKRGCVDPSLFPELCTRLGIKLESSKYWDSE